MTLGEIVTFCEHFILKNKIQLKAQYIFCLAKMDEDYRRHNRA